MEKMFERRLRNLVRVNECRVRLCPAMGCWLRCSLRECCRSVTGRNSRFTSFAELEKAFDLAPRKGVEEERSE